MKLITKDRTKLITLNKYEKILYEVKTEVIDGRTYTYLVAKKIIKQPTLFDSMKTK